MTVPNAAILQNVPLFGLLTDDEILLLAQQIQRRHFLKGQLIFSIGDEGSEMYIVETGQVELFVNNADHERINLRSAEVGHVFGELSALDKQTRSASAIAAENTTLLVVTRDDLYTLIKTHPSAALHMMQVMSNHLRQTTLMMREHGIRNANVEISAKAGSFGDRLSDFMIGASSNIYFIIFSFIWFTVWISWNLGIIPNVEPFDPFPFGLLTMIVSLEMVFLSLFILIKQTRQAESDKVRNDVEYDVNVRAEAGIRALTKQVEQLQQLVLYHAANGNMNTMQHAAKHDVSLNSPPVEADTSRR